MIQSVPEVVPKGVPSDLSMRCPKWENKIAQHGLPVQTFSFIMWRESRCHLRAHNTTLNADVDSVASGMQGYQSSQERKLLKQQIDSAAADVNLKMAQASKEEALADVARQDAVLKEKYGDYEYYSRVQASAGAAEASFAGMRPETW